ncbi:MAG TPA: nuclear transport factor 2 family protein [Flavisolibacter sp.]
MKKLVLLCFVMAPVFMFAQKKDEVAIRTILAAQTSAWNRGDLEGFMQGYWQNDSLMFIGRNGIKWGWQTTLDNYRKGYPDTTAMGQLTFDLLQVKKLSRKYYYVVGKWTLRRTIGDVSGHFDLLFRKIRGRWQIIADHSS